MFAAIAIAGYLSSFSETEEVICNRDPMNSMGGKGGIDYYMTVGKLGVYITLVISIPVVYVGLRRSLYNLVCGSKSIITNPKYIINIFIYRNIFITGGVLTITTIVAIFFTDIKAALSITGGIGPIIFSFFVPSTRYIYIYINIYI